MKHIFFSTLFLLCTLSVWAQTPTDEEKLEEYKELLTLKQKQINIDKELKQKKEDSLATFNTQLQKLQAEFKVKSDTLLAVQKRLKKTSATLDDKSTELTSKEETLKNTQTSLNENKQKREADQGTLNTVTSNLQTDQTDLQVHQKQLKDFQEKVNLVTKKVEVNQTTFDSKTQALTQKQTQIKTTRQNLDTQEKKLEELKTKAKTLDGDISVAKSDIQTKFQKVVDFNTSVTNSSNSLSQQMTSLTDVQNNLKTKTNEVLAIKKQIETEEQKLKNTTLGKVEVQNTQKKINSLHTKQATLFSEVLNLNNKLKAIGNENESILIRLQNLEKEKVLATNNLTHAHEELINLNTEKSGLDNNIKNVSLEVDRLNKEETALQYDIQQLDNDIAKLKTEKVELKKEQDWVTVKRNEEKDLVAQLTKSINSLETEKKTLTSNIEDYNEKITSLQNTVDQLDKEIPALQTEVKALTSTQETLTKKEKVTTEEKEVLNKKIEKLTVITTRLETELSILRINDNIASILLQGIDFGLKDDFKHAITSFKKASSQEPKSREPYYLTAYSEYVLKDYKKSLKYLNKSIVADGRFFDAYFLKAEVNEAQGHYIGAINDYNIINSLDSVNVKAYDHKGRIFHDFLMEWDLACENWDKAIELGSDFAKNEKERHCNIPLEDRKYIIAQITKMSNDDGYGFSETKPISVGLKNDATDRASRKINIESYLGLLRDAKGHTIKYQRIRSCCPYESKSPLAIDDMALVEEYQITYKDSHGKKQVRMLYLTFYEYEKPHVPVGLKTNFDIK